LQDARVGQRWRFSGKEEANAGVENVLQTCLAIFEKEREKEREREKREERKRYESGA
jgi:hypothetical protein